MTDELRCDDPPPEPHHGFTFSLERRIRAPLDVTFSWWTDFDPIDAALSDASRLLSRGSVRRQGDRVWKQDLNRIGPFKALTDTVVDLHPPDRWTLVAESPLHGVRGRYRLTEDEGGCVLRGEWHVFARRSWLVPAFAVSKRRAMRDLAREWDGYIAALEHGSPPVAPP